jgi:hypothetical protein
MALFILLEYQQSFLGHETLRYNFRFLPLYAVFEIVTLKTLDFKPIHTEGRNFQCEKIAVGSKFNYRK